MTVPSCNDTPCHVGDAEGLAFILACVAVAPRLPEWRGYVLYSLVSGLLMAALGVVLLGFTGASGPFAGYTGLIQRVWYFFALLWPLVIGLRIARGTVMTPATAT